MRFKFAPGDPRARPPADLLPALEHEFASESAASLGAAYRDVLKALEKARAGLAGALAADERELALNEAGEALWRFVVQREACGFRNTEQVLREMDVPPAIRLRMGIRHSR